MEWSTIFFFLLVSAIFFHACLRLSRKTKIPPGPTGQPIVGCLFRLGKRPHETFSNWAKIYGPLMSLKLGFVTTVVASTAQMAREILQKNEQNFACRPVPDVIMAQPNYDCTLGWALGDSRWRNRRRVCTTKMFTTHRLDALQGLRHKKVNQVLDYMHKKGLMGESVDIGQIAFATSINLISNTIFSMDLVDPKFESAQEFKDLVWTIMEDGAKPNFSDYFPLLRRFDLQGLRKHIMPSYGRMHEIFDEIIDRRLKAKASGSNLGTGDFLDILLNQCQEEDTKFDSEDMKPLFLDLFIAGSDTTSITVEWAMAELLRNPKLMQRARKELMETIGAERAVEEADADKLPYLQAILKETLRLHPPAPLLLPYRAENDVEIGGFTVPQGSHVLVNAWAIARDPSSWDNPTLFSPERFLDSSVDFKGMHFEYIPFGAGRRLCPGLPLALRMAPLMLASFIHSFNWKLPDGISPENIDMTEQFGITLKKAVPFRAIPIKREVNGF